MLIYLCGAFSNRAHLNRLAGMIAGTGADVCSNWHREAGFGKRGEGSVERSCDFVATNPEAADDGLGANAEKVALMNLTDLSRADMCLFVNWHVPMQLQKGTRHFEMGFAFALGIPCAILGSPTNICHLIKETVTMRLPNQPFLNANDGERKATFFGIKHYPDWESLKVALEKAVGSECLI